jgi:phage-related protein
MEDQNHFTYEQRARSKVSGAVSSTKSAGSEVAQGAREKIDQLKGGISSVKDKVQSTKTQATGYVQNLKSGITSAVESTREAAHNASEKVGSLKETITEKVSGDQSGKSIVVKDGTSNEWSDMSDTQRAQTIEEAKSVFGNSGREADSGVSGIVAKDGASNEWSDVSDDQRTKIIEDAQSAFSEEGSISAAASEITQKIPSMDNVKETVSDFVQDKVEEGVETLKSIDPLTYVAIGAGLGTLTGLGLPVPEAEQEMVDKLDEKIGSFTQDLQSALNESADILKNLVISDFKNFNVNIFKR